MRRRPELAGLLSDNSETKGADFKPLSHPARQYTFHFFFYFNTNGSSHHLLRKELSFSQSVEQRDSVSQVLHLRAQKIVFLTIPYVSSSTSVSVFLFWLKRRSDNIAKSKSMNMTTTTSSHSYPYVGVIYLYRGHLF